MPTLDEYRRSLVVRLEGCVEAAQVKTLLAEADLWLTVSRISDAGQVVFWRSVKHELAFCGDQWALSRAKALASIRLRATSRPEERLQRQVALESDDTGAPA